MKKRIIISLVQFFFIVQCNAAQSMHPAWIEDADTVEFSSFSKVCYRRYYLVGRLTRLFAPLAQIETIIKDSGAYDHLPQCSSRRMQNCVKSMQKQQSLQPLQVVWGNIIAFHYLDDFELIKDIALCIQSLFKSAYHVIYDVPPVYAVSTSNDSIEYIIQKSHSCLDKLLIKKPLLLPYVNYKPTVSLTKIENQLIDFGCDMVKEVGPEHVALRYYLISNLIELLTRFGNYKDNDFVFNKAKFENNILTIDGLTVQLEHPFGQTCMQSILETKKINGFFHYWSKLQEFSEISSFECMKDFLKIALLLNIQILHELYGNTLPVNIRKEVRYWMNNINTFKVMNFIEIISRSTDRTRLADRSLISHRSNTFSNQFADEMFFDPTKFATLVLHRFYFIQRLTPIIKTLVKVGQVNYDPDMILNYDSQNLINSQDPLPLRMQNPLKKSQYDLKPLFLVWSDFISYRSIEDQVFIEEFTKEILLVSASIKHSYMHNNKGKKQKDSVDISDPLSPGDALNRYYFGHTPDQIELEKDFDEFANVNKIIMRSYIISRLAHHFSALQAEIGKLKFIPFTLKDLNADVVRPDSKKVLALIEKTNSLIPMFNHFKRFSEYRYINNSQVEKDLLVITEELLSAIIRALNPKVDPLKTVLTQGSKPYPLEKKLDHIDVLMEQFGLLIKNYIHKQSLFEKILSLFYQKDNSI